MPAGKTESTRIQVVSQAFRYCEYGAGQGQTRTLRIGATPLQLVVNLWRDEALKDKEVEIQVEIRDEKSGSPIFETLWVTKLTHARQESALVFQELPPELKALKPDAVYAYYASALVNDSNDFAERTTRAVAK
ncbi:MAG: hypothetical protein NTW19_07775 [Planctomycetota bacterium]|nr:hypothetical protein [Planctomycetota bacterium]